MSQTTERGLDALTDEEWGAIDDMAEEFDDEFGEDLRAIHDGYHEAEEAGDGR